MFASILSGISILVVLAVGILALLFMRKTRSGRLKNGYTNDVESAGSNDEGSRVGGRVAPERKVKAGGTIVTRSTGNHMVVAIPNSLYGAYRIEQEVGKLVLRQPHRKDVLSSRAPEDRRAIETSLIKMVASSPDENERRLASQALEEYGFVARECATLLMAPDAFDRTTAARSLGEIKSPAALPFLLEALYDSESTVRNQVVASIGELKVPSALLDMARRRPDVPANLISQALGACSVDGLDFLDSKISEPAIGDGGFEGFGSDITTLEPAGSVKELPADSDDEGIRRALLAIQTENASERVEGAKELAKYQVQTSVDGLMTLARVDEDASVRAQAISSLSLINHESVFPAVLIGMADDSREVRAAAARSLSHLSSSRTDAYIRVLETDDQQLLAEVARACIKAGIVSQAIDRLATGDRRQAYETFSIFSLLARAKQSQPVLDAIVNHSKLRVRLASLRLLTNTGEPEVFEQLRQVAGRDDLAEGLRTALLEAMYKLDQSNAESKTEPPAEPLSSSNDLVFKINSPAGVEVDAVSTQSPDPQS